jgi:hypothetical protein
MESMRFPWVEVNEEWSFQGVESEVLWMKRLRHRLSIGEMEDI